MLNTDVKKQRHRRLVISHKKASHVAKVKAVSLNAVSVARVNHFVFTSPSSSEKQANRESGGWTEGANQKSQKSPNSVHSIPVTLS